jgi:autotransporter passenger strand-loop-strand repeat protein
VSAVLSDQSDQYISSGGAATGTVLNAAYADVLTSGKSVSATVSAYGGLYVSGGTASHTVVQSAGYEYVYSGTAISTIVSSGGTLNAQGGTVSNTVLSGGTMVLDGGAASGTITFAGSGGEIQEYATTSAVISGFAAGDTVDLYGYYDYSNTATVAVASAGVVTVSAGGSTYTFDVAGAAVGETDFTVSAALYGYYGFALGKESASSNAMVASVPANPAPQMAFLSPVASTVAASAATVPALSTVLGGGAEWGATQYAATVTTGATVSTAAPLGVLFAKVPQGGSAVLAPVTSQTHTV